MTCIVIDRYNPNVNIFYFVTKSEIILLQHGTMFQISEEASKYQPFLAKYCMELKTSFVMQKITDK